MSQVLTDYEKSYIAGSETYYMVNGEALADGDYIISNQPDVPRNVNITNDNLGTPVTQGILTITGTKWKGVVVAETFDLSTDVSFVGTQTFRTITVIAISGLTGGVGSLLYISDGRYIQITEGLTTLESVILSNSGTHVGTLYIIDGVDPDTDANVAIIAQDKEGEFTYDSLLWKGLRFYLEGDSPITTTYYK
jgi:hypothetical protein